MSLGQSIIKVCSSIYEVINTISGNTILGKICVAAGALITAYFTPIIGLLACCFTASTVDMFYGIAVAKKQHCKITSDHTRHGTWNKIKAEFAIICLARMLEYAVLGTESVFVLTGGATVIITLTEMWSILENLNTLNPKGPWRALGKFLKKKGEDYTGINIEENNDNNGTNNPSMDKQPS